MPTNGKAPMMDGRPKRKVPKAGPDLDEAKQNAGKLALRLPDQDGPAKRSANPTPKKPATSAGKGKAGKLKPKHNLAAMKADLDKIGSFKR